MAIIIDLVIVGIIALCVIIGYAKGLTGALIKIVSFVLSLVIAFILYTPISNYIINNTQIDDMLETTIKSSIIKDDEEQAKEQMPTVITDYINQKVEEASNAVKENVVNSTAQEVSHTIVRAGTWIILFVIARIALIVLKYITAIIARLPVIKQFDKLGGIIYGLLEGLVITYFALALISFITPMTKENLSDSINKSYIGSSMYNNNLLLKIIF